MIVSFVFPTQKLYSGGVVALMEFANGLARRGHDVHFLHGPAWAGRIDRVDEITWFSFHPAVQHHVVDSMDDPALPEADVVFSPSVPRRLGLPAAFIQGHGMMAEAWERAALRAPCPKFCIARWLTDVGRYYGAPAAQMLHVPMGIDHDLFAVRRPVDDRPLDVAVQYSPHPAKGWRTASRALTELRTRRPDLRVAAFSVLPAETPLPPWIDFHHDPPRQALADDIYNAAKVFLQASHYEGFGFTPVEAMACGAALVTTDNGGSRDYAIPDRTALVTPVDDPTALAAATEALLDEPVRRTALAEAGEQHVRRFDWDRGAAVLEAHLLAYVADPQRFQEPPGLDLSLEHGPFRVQDLPVAALRGRS